MCVLNGSKDECLDIGCSDELLLILLSGVGLCAGAASFLMSPLV